MFDWKRTAFALAWALVALTLSAQSSAAPPLEDAFVHEMRDAPREGQTRSGVGFFIDNRGTLVTAAHVVAGCRQLTVQGSMIQQMPVTLIALDTRIDAAVLRAPTGSGYWVDVSPDPPRATDRLLLYTADRERERRDRFAAGAIRGNERAGAINLLVVVPDLQRGASGSPIFDGRARVVGMSVSRTDGAMQSTLVMPSHHLRRFLSGVGLLPQRDGIVAEFLGRSERIDQVGVERLSHAIVDIECT